MKPLLIHLLAACILSLVLAPGARAEFSDANFAAPYSPELAPSDKPLELRPCQRAATTAPITARFNCTDDSFIELINKSPRPGVGRLEMALKLDIRKRWRHVANAAEFGRLETVHQTDFNFDGVPDFVLEFSHQSKGSTTTQRDMLFFISSPEGYVWQRIDRLRSPSTRHFYTEAGSRVVFLTTRFHVDASAGPLAAQAYGRNKFWVFDPVYFNKATNYWTYFPQEKYPVWVEYTKVPQNKPTELIEPRVQKQITEPPVRGVRGGNMQTMG